jgi:hypothetical protein
LSFQLSALHGFEHSDLHARRLLPFAVRLVP